MGQDITYEILRRRFGGANIRRNWWGTVRVYTSTGGVARVSHNELYVEKPCPELHRKLVQVMRDAGWTTVKLGGDRVFRMTASAFAEAAGLRVAFDLPEAKDAHVNAILADYAKTGAEFADDDDLESGDLL